MFVFAYFRKASRANSDCVFRWRSGVPIVLRNQPKMVWGLFRLVGHWQIRRLHPFTRCGLAARSITGRQFLRRLCPGLNTQRFRVISGNGRGGRSALPHPKTLMHHIASLLQPVQTTRLHYRRAKRHRIETGYLARKISRRTRHCQQVRQS
jgi:hypothetical protein